MGGLDRNAQEPDDVFRIDQPEAHIGVVHKRQLENRISVTQLVHVDQQALAVLVHHVLDVVVPVHQVGILRHGCDQPAEFFILFRVQALLRGLRPAQHLLLHRRQDVVLHFLGVDDFQQVDASLRDLVRRLFTAVEQVSKAFGVQQLKHGAVAAVFNAYHVIGNGRRHPRHEGQPRQFPLPVNILQRVGIQEDLHDRIRGDPVDLTVGAPADHLAPFHRDDAVSFSDIRQVRKPRHIQDFIHFGMNIDEFRVRHLLDQPQKYPQPRAGSVLQLVAVQVDPVVRMGFLDFLDLFLHLLRVGRVNDVAEADNQPAVFLSALHHFCPASRHTGQSLRIPGT